MTFAQEAWRLTFGSLPVAEGFALREAAVPRHFETNDPGRFGGLLSVDDLDAFLKTGSAATPTVALADSRRTGSAAVPESDFTYTDGKIDPSRLYALFDEGATLVVSQFHEHHARLAAYCRGLEKVFGHGVQANIYLTPPGAKGFRVHFDSHDVLVLQVSGEKRWRVWDEGPVPFATRNTPWEAGLFQADDATARTVDMRPGDVLYLPRGAPHDAAAQGSGEPSLHITVGLLDYTFADVLKAAIEQLEPREKALREPFPMWRLGDPDRREGLVQALAERARILGSSNALDLAALSILQAFATERMPMVSRGLRAPVPGAADRLIVADGVHHHVVPTETGAELRWAGLPIVLSATELGWLERLSEGARAADLGGEESLTFCRKLASLGLLEPA